MPALRTIQARYTLLLVLFASFALMRFAPGGPFDGERPLAPETRAALEAAYGLNLPMGEQFALFLQRTLTGGNAQAITHRQRQVGDEHVGLLRHAADCLSATNCAPAPPTTT